MTLPFTTTIAGHWLTVQYSMMVSNVLQLMNRQLFYVWGDYIIMSCDNHKYQAKKFGSLLIYTYGFMQCHTIGVTGCLYSFTVIYLIHSVHSKHKEIKVSLTYNVC